jgi:hypothetical protein
VTETTAGGHTQNGTVVYAASASEAVTSTDSPNGLPVKPAAASESVSRTDSASGSLAVAAAAAETRAATESALTLFSPLNRPGTVNGAVLNYFALNSDQLVGTGVVQETAAATDSASSSVVYAVARTESVAASDTSSSVIPFTSAVAETSTAAHTQTSTQFYGAAIVESGVAISVQSVTWVVVVSATDARTVSDTTDTSEDAAPSYVDASLGGGSSYQIVSQGQILFAAELLAGATTAAPNTLQASVAETSLQASVYTGEVYASAEVFLVDASAEAA